MNTYPQPAIATLCYLIENRDGEEKILLARKARTEKAVRRGVADLLNGYGGDYEDSDQTVFRTCARELQDESTLIVNESDLTEVARITYDNNGKNRVLVHVFRTHTHQGEPVDSDEMCNARWYRTDNLPYDQMPAGDRLVLPHIIEGRKVIGTVWYDESRKVKRHEITVVDNLPS